MNQTKLTIGELSVTQVSATDAPSAAAIICHGFGAGGDDLVPLAEEMVRADDKLQNVAFLFPAGPLDLSQLAGFESRAWWMIDMEKIQSLAMKGEFRELKSESPEDLPKCNQMIRGVIDHVCQEFSIPKSKIVLGGFSQGAMLTTDVALTLDEPVGGLLIWSGTVICDRWRR